MKRLLKIIGLVSIVLMLAGCNKYLMVALTGGLGGMIGVYATQDKHSSVQPCPDALRCMAKDAFSHGEGYEGEYRFRCKLMWKDSHEGKDRMKHHDDFIANGGNPCAGVGGGFFDFVVKVKVYRNEYGTLVLDYSGKGNNYKKIGGTIAEGDYPSDLVCGEGQCANGTT